MPLDLIDNISSGNGSVPSDNKAESKLTQISVVISMGLCKKDVTPLLTHWSYIFLALTHRYGVTRPQWLNRTTQQYTFAIQIWVYTSVWYGITGIFNQIVVSVRSW